MTWKANAVVRGQRSRLKMSYGKKTNRWLFHRHQSFPMAAECQLDSKRRCQKQIYFSCFNFLKVSRGDLRFFCQLVLRQMSAYTLTAHVCAEGFNSFPFFPGYGHDILHRFPWQIVNDTYIVKIFSLCLKETTN